MKGKPWTPEEEKKLQMMLQENKSIRVIAKTLGKTRDGIRMKLARLEVVVHPEKNTRTTTTSCPDLVLPVELPSIEDTLKVPGLDKTEVLRLRGIIAGCKEYKAMLIEYMDYRGLESELLELREKYEELSKKTSSFQPK
jgi:hypothetical protein